MAGSQGLPLHAHSEPSASSLLLSLPAGESPHYLQIHKEAPSTSLEAMEVPQLSLYWAPKAALAEGASALPGWSICQAHAIFRAPD